MKKFLPFLTLLIFSVFLIFYRFTDIPKYLAFDEVEFAKLALSLDGKPYMPYSQLATGHSTLYFYILLASLKTFGINTFALRFPSAVFGILSVIMFYGVINKLKDYELRITNFNVLPLVLSLVLLTSRWFLNFSRFSFEATFLLFLELTSIYFLISKKSLIISGIFAGLAFLSYTPGRIFFLLPLFFVIFQRIGQVQDLPLHKKTQQFINITIKQFLLFLIPFLIIITPLTNYFMTNKDTRIDQQFFLRNHEMPIQEKLTGLWHNISSTALMFNIKGDSNGRHNYPNKPALNPILGTLFLIGFVLTMKSVFAKASTDKQWNNNINKLFLIYFLLSILPALMTYPWENPNMLRTYTVLPSVVYFIGNAIYHLSSIVQRLSLNKKVHKYLILNTLYLVLILSCLYELRTYFKYQSEVFTHSFQIKLPLEKAIRMKIKI